MAEQALLIGGVAAGAGVNVQTVRYYERRGLLPAPRRSAGGRRLYPPDAVRLLQFIRRAQDLGFSLREIGELIRLRTVRGRERASVRLLATGKLTTVREKVGRLLSIERALQELLIACDCADAQVACPILEALDDDAPRKAARGQPTREE